MRIDNTGIYEIANKNIGTDMKETGTVEKKDSCSISSSLITETPYSVTAATVEKALFSLESELDKVKQGAQNIDLDLIKTQMAILSNTLSGEDLKKMQQEGYSLNETDVDTIVTVMDKIKVELAKGGMDIGIFGDDLSMEQLEAVTGSAGQAMQMASELTQCQDEDIAYLVENECEPTIENLYWAQHSGSRRRQTEAGALPGDDKLRRQIEQVIAQANLPVNDTTLGYGAFLLQQDIPVTPENISYVAQLKNLKLPLEEMQVEAAISTAVQEGRKPQEAYLLAGYGYKDRAIKAQEVIENAQPEDLAALAEKGETVTIEKLAQMQQVEPYQGNAEYRRITARRQLEEIRLIMTTRANYQLLKQGISIETMELEALVEELKGMEEQFYKRLLQGQGLEPTTENAVLLQETLTKTAELKYFPSYLMARVQIETTTIQVLHQEGSQLKAALEQANEAYETMMTSPRADMGDSIQRAFRNVDDILADLDMEISAPNQRAVRILAYNEITITTESITQMKAADEKMQNLFRNLKPQVVMELIREGENPLTMSVTELNSKAEEIVRTLDPAQEMKYSEYLWELEQRHQITPEERESYVGIYRLLRQIEKTDGAVIGAVVNQGGELSLKNLLSAVRSRKVYGTDVKIDESFGGIEKIEDETAAESITRQIEAAYQTDCAKEAYKQLTPSALEKCMAQENWQELTPEQLLWQLREYSQVQETSEQQMQQEQYQQQESNWQMDMFRSNQTTETAVLQMMQEYDIPMDTYHIMAVGQMVNNRNAVFRKLFDGKNADKVPNLQEVKAELLEKFAEAVKTPEDMAKAQQALAETAENIMETMIEEPDMTSLDVRDLKLLRTQIQISTKMSQEEHYAIPVLVADELTNVQLKIVRGKEKRGMVDILFGTEKLGKVAARIQVSAARTEGLIVAERLETMEQLKQQEDVLCNRLQIQEHTVRFDFAVQENLNLNDFTKGTGKNQKPDNTEDYQVQTMQLYSIAREFLEIAKGL